MLAEVVGLNGQTIFQPKADAVVVSQLKTWLDRAEAGEVVGVAVAAVYRDGSLGQSYIGVSSRGLVGVLFSLAQRVSAAVDGE